MESNTGIMPPQIRANVPLATFTTLGVGGVAEYFAEVSDIDALQDVIAWAETNDLNVTILGDGSNVLVSDAGVAGLVVRPRFMETVFKENGETVLVEVGAGVSLDTLVEDVVSKNLWGIENLSGIPGTVGATPVQNVGAYGVEVKDIIFSVRVYDRETKKSFEIKNDACAFSYRDSLFKKSGGKKFIITHVTFQLSKKSNPKISYKDLVQYFERNSSPTIREIRNAVIETRSKKFPDWNVVGTAGSFFKNPIITKAHYDELLAEYPDIPRYSTESGDMKVALGWILEHVCNLKGYREGRVGLFEKQALVLVCEKGTRAREIEIFSEKIISFVYERTKIIVEREVTIIK